MSKRMRRCYCTLGFITSLLGLLSCGAAENPAARNQSLADDVEQLKEDLRELEKSLALHQRIERLRREPYKTATFDPVADRFYSRVDANVGTFAVSMKDLLPYGDGMKVRMTLGNLSTALFNGATLSVKWGPRMPAFPDDSTYSAKYAAWQSSLDSMDISITDQLQPGSWNPITIILPNTSAQKFGYIQVGIATDQIKLRGGE